MRPVKLASSCLAVLLPLGACGGSSDSPTVTPTPVVTPTPAPTSTPVAASCPAPTPPPLRYRAIKVHNDLGYRKVLDTKPLVENVDGYCGKVGLSANARFCETRPEDSPERAGCDYMAVGRAKDTGRYGPTWFYEGRPCAAGPDQPGCTNHESNQFLVVAKGPGEYAACAADEVPLVSDGERCGVCKLGSTSTACNQ